MTHPWLDALRYVVFCLFGVGCGFMLITNIMAFRVLRPPRGLGFLWWHITAVSLSQLCYGGVAVVAVAGRLGGPIVWATPVVLLGSVVFATSQVLIFRIERQRFVEHVARRGVRDRS